MSLILSEMYTPARWDGQSFSSFPLISIEYTTFFSESSLIAGSAMRSAWLIDWEGRFIDAFIKRMQREGSRPLYK